MYGSRLWLTLRELVFLLLIPGILGWGEEGHYATCKIAEGYLNEEALAVVKQLLPASAKGDLASVCSWPDDIRKQYRWSSALHFADTPDFKCNYEYCRDCHDTAGNKDRCVTGAIYNYTKQLSGYQDPIVKSKYNLTEALLFLSHFFGDVHQPLHMGYLGDLGGNLIPIHWYDKNTNLHRVWDDMIIDSALKSFYDSDLRKMIQDIQRKIENGWSSDASTWTICENNRIVCPDLYASESIISACKFAYTNATSGSTLGDEYFLSRLPVVEKKLAKGGVRLAATLNRIFSYKAKLAVAEA
ncbi:S1/P1 nuclease [Trema orientale]|uniref:Aspergillus nuclease S1 n=1 Tax=Trema orientale TaxID=63057 RepID=A0A2P5G0X6_TREOI|nr:S1/P1 nuclease [Trema orientale]